MERMLCLLLFIFIPAVLPVTAQSVTLSTEGPFVENSAVSFLCQFTSQWDPRTLRGWIGPGSNTLISNGASTSRNKYSEDISNAAGSHQYSMTIQNYNSGDEGLYQCQYGFFTSNLITVSISNTEVHPVPPPLIDLAIPVAGEAIDLTFYVPGIRPAARVSFNLTTSTQTVIVSDDAIITNVNNADGRTVTSVVKIDVPGRTEVGDILTITVMVGTYIDSRQWTIKGYFTG
ncbi:uncharacterized protein [Argopecten irradians]|uniref:uncharacterized protein n=1 Tax=Argopecten irradians TaxID=31199 RepID=UPI0037218535